MCGCLTCTKRYLTFCVRIRLERDPFDKDKELMYLNVSVVRDFMRSLR